MCFLYFMYLKSYVVVSVDPSTRNKMSPHRITMLQWMIKNPQTIKVHLKHSRTTHLKNGWTYIFVYSSHRQWIMSSSDHVILLVGSPHGQRRWSLISIPGKGFTYLKLWCNMLQGGTNRRQHWHLSFFRHSFQNDIHSSHGRNMKFIRPKHKATQKMEKFCIPEVHQITFITFHRAV